MTFTIASRWAHNIRKMARHVAYPVRVCGLLALFVGSFCAAKNRPARVNLFPRLQAGQTLAYQISYHSDKQVKTKSSVIVATPADSAKIDVNALLRLEILGVQAQGDRAIIRARTKFEVLASDSNFKTPGFEPPSPQVQRQDPKGKFVEFTILPDGRLDQVTGLDALFPEQQQAWQEWVSRFLIGAELRTSSVRISQKWNSAEAEKAPAPLAGLRWIRQSTYVRDEPCHGLQLTAQGSVAPSDAEPETCAVILTTAVLNQASSEKNATPEDFKLHELRTSGTARGANRIITYISLKTGLLMRATEEASQEMNVTVAKADGSNRVHYDVNAKSRSEVVQVVQTALNPNNSQ
jgi:hypothetical protein